MPLNKSLRQYPIREGNVTYSNSSNQDTRITINVPHDKSNLNQTKFDPSTLVDGVILVTPVLFLFTTVGVIFYRFKQVKPVSLPCKNCKYYDSNNYLKCAVNPAEVLTEKAKDCRDYSSQVRKFPWYSWKGFYKRV
jgi:hypothetical protein